MIKRGTQNVTKLYRGTREVKRVYRGTNIVYEAEAPEPVENEPSKLYFTLTSDLTQPLYFTQSKANGVTIDWGDGSAAETYEGTANTSTDEETGEEVIDDYSVSASHTYAEAGDYVVKMTSGEGVTWSPGASISSKNYCICGSVTVSSKGNTNTYPTLTAFMLGTGAELSQAHGFENCTSIESVVIPEGITELGSFVFCKCTGLTSVTIPRSLTRMGYGVFTACEGISALYISDIAAWCMIDVDEAVNLSYDTSYATNISSPHTLYLDGQPVTNLVIPEGVTRIGKRAFFACTSITSVITPTTLTYISASVFAKCTALQSAVLRGNPESITDTSSNIHTSESFFGMFNGCTALETLMVEGWQQIREQAFGGCSNLKSVTLDMEAGRIEASAFQNKPNLVNVSLSGVAYIGSSAFNSCTSLRSLDLPNDVQTVVGDAFSECTELTSVSIGSGLKSLSYTLFKGCTSLTNISVSAGNEVYASLDGVVFDKDLGAIVMFPPGRSGSYTVPDFVREVRVGAFEYSVLTEIILPSSIEAIREQAFDSSAIEKMIVSSGVLEKRAFAYCESLSAVWLRSGITEVTVSATTNKNETLYVSPFYNCDSSLTLYCEPSSRPSGWDSHFNVYDGKSTLTTRWGQTTSPF